MDTRAILSSLLELKSVDDIIAFTYSGTKKHIEQKVISEILKSTKLPHKYFNIDKDIKGNFFNNLISLTPEFDGELPGLIFYYLIPAFKMHKGLNSVLFSGIGGEIFKGEHYRVGYRKEKILKDPLEHLVRKLIYRKSYLYFLKRELSGDPYEILRESIAQEIKNCDSVNSWSLLDIFHMRNELRRSGGAGIWALNRNLMACIPFLDNDFVEFNLKFCNYENNQAKIHFYIINNNNKNLARISQYYFGGSYWITNRMNYLEKILIYWSLIRNLSFYLARHYFSIAEDNFGLRYMLQNNIEDFEKKFSNSLLRTKNLYQENRFISILEKEKSNGFLHYYDLGYILTIEIIAQFLNTKD